MATYIIETIDNATSIGYTGMHRYSVQISKGRGVGIYRRRLAVVSKRELDKRLNELADSNTTVLAFDSDAAAIAYARDTAAYLNAGN